LSALKKAGLCLAFFLRRLLATSRASKAGIIITNMQLAAPLDETQLARLVDRFYEQVRLDPLLGAVFNAAVHDWDEHKRTLVSFWTSVALRAGSYRGNPMAVHRMQPISAEHFERWLALWRTTANACLDEASAAQMIEHAERIGRSLRLGLGLPEHLQARSLDLPIVGRH
jgi:hemoglobin